MFVFDIVLLKYSCEEWEVISEGEITIEMQGENFAVWLLTLDPFVTIFQNGKLCSYANKF